MNYAENVREQAFKEYKDFGRLWSSYGANEYRSGQDERAHRMRINGETYKHIAEYFSSERNTKEMFGFEWGAIEARGWVLRHEHRIMSQECILKNRGLI